MADLKITLFFFDHCSGKIYRQNEDRDIVKLLTIFHDKTPQRSAPWIYFFMGGNKTNIGEEPRIKGDCTVFFSFRIYKKKHFTQNPNLLPKVDKKPMLMLTSGHFGSFSGNLYSKGSFTTYGYASFRRTFSCKSWAQAGLSCFFLFCKLKKKYLDGNNNILLFFLAQQ